MRCSKGGKTKWLVVILFRNWLYSSVLTIDVKRMLQRLLDPALCTTNTQVDRIAATFSSASPSGVPQPPRALPGAARTALTPTADRALHARSP
jgi:hypothetical protein